MIECRSICAGYNGTEVLHGITASLEHGRLISVIGPNGCGKSTLFKTMAGILRYTGGDCMLDGSSLASLGAGETAKHIAYLAQGRTTPDMTVGELVLHGRFAHLQFPRRYSAHDRDIARAAMERMGISEYTDKPLSSLSGGMRQCAYLAMALAQETDYILLDEPTTYLDISNRLSLMRQLQTLAGEGRGIAAVMHDLPLALSCSDEIWVINNGRIAMIGTPEETVSSGIVETLFGVSVCCADGDYYYRLQNSKNTGDKEL